MLHNLKVNRLLLGVVGMNAAYWSFGALAMLSVGGGIWWSAFVSACLLVAGSLLASTVLPDAVRVVRKGEVGSGEIAILAIAMISGGLMWSGAFSLAYNYFGRPQEWIGPFSAYGRACVSVGMVLMFLAPEATRKGLRAPRWWVILAGVILIALVGFFFGVTFGGDNGSISGAFDTSRATKMTDIASMRRA